MNNYQFSSYKKKIINRYNNFFTADGLGIYDEQAIPAYTNPNPLMSWLFWERIHRVINLLENYNPLSVSLDFGCGFGSMLPYLNSNSETVIAIDLEIEKLKNFSKEENWERVIYGNSIEEFLPLYKNKVNVILALDVLEHVTNVEFVLEQFRMLLRPDGVIIISGPTENLIYKLGRWLAGYSGDYHRRNIYNIRDNVKNIFKINYNITILPLIPFFLIFAAKNKI